MVDLPALEHNPVSCVRVADAATSSVSQHARVKSRRQLKLTKFTGQTQLFPPVKHPVNSRCILGDEQLHWGSAEDIVWTCTPPSRSQRLCMEEEETHCGAERGLHIHVKKMNQPHPRSVSEPQNFYYYLATSVFVLITLACIIFPSTLTKTEPW